MLSVQCTLYSQLEKGQTVRCALQNVEYSTGNEVEKRCWFTHMFLYIVNYTLIPENTNNLFIKSSFALIYREFQKT